MDEPKDRANAMQAAFTIAFGFGGLATLGLFTRRQWHQERVHEHTEYDAEQRRITEQYVQAVEQLGHEKAPVRLGGLYALDRLGRNHPEQRQVISEVWCAYLRRRYTPPVDILSEAREGDEGEEAEPTEEQLQKDAEAADEYEVRMTAQRLLAGHLKDPRPEEERDDARPDESDEFWHLEHVDLTGATLIDADFDGCQLPILKADRARFYRSTSFFGTYFGGAASFVGVRFGGAASFDGVRFGGEASFGEARFGGAAWFDGVRFGGDAWFGGVRFGGEAWFDGAQFERVAWFGEARFEHDAWFGGARFGGSAGFGGVRFGGSAGFDEARFRGAARFDGVRFGGAAWFDEVRFESTEETAEGSPLPDGRFVMDEAIVYRIEFEDEEHVWPPGWEPVPDGDKWRLVRVEE
ncbi:pentapeptide repeat-containing protein [Glycomyces tenuis]|uniref:pentapeptide repeat-containing protein n=2 Tax=Glycomyces tenuis TaxID=58116 RepID=UPI0012DDBCB1|nr:pentapeptide repeat-containing protein [Glycomyces tenuis]